MRTIELNLKKETSTPISNDENIIQPSNVDTFNKINCIKDKGYSKMDHFHLLLDIYNEDKMKKQLQSNKFSEQNMLRLFRRYIKLKQKERDVFTRHESEINNLVDPKLLLERLEGRTLKRCLSYWTSLESCIKRNFDKMDVKSINSSLTSEYKIFRKYRVDSSSDKIINKSVTHIVDDHITIQKISESKLNNTSIPQLLPLVEGVDNLNSTQ